MILSALGVIRRNRELTWTLVKRDIQARYKGSWMGSLWSIANPIIMLCIYTFVFSSVFDARWGPSDTAGGQNATAFAINLFAGLIVFNMFAECASKSPSLIVNNANYVKKVIFPIEILSTVTIASALYHALIGLAILVIGKLIVNHSIESTVVYLPLIWLPYLGGLVGFSWLISAAGVFIRDIGQIINSFISIMMFMSPIFYPSSAVPTELAWVTKLNPIGYVIEATRGVLIEGVPPKARVVLVYWICMILLCEISYRYLKRNQRKFGDLL